jgi:Leucine-rich repeat (LRR) protein
MPTVYYTDGSCEKIKDYDIYDKGRDFNDENTINFIKDRIIKTNSININGIINYKYIGGYNGNCFRLNIIPQINNSFLKELQKDFSFVKKFYMSNNLINDGELDFTMFKNLENVKLSINLLTKIPKSIFKLKKLKKLFIRGLPYMEFCFEAPYSYIKKIPKEIKNLQNLLVLDLSSQELSSLPSEFKELTNLKELYLSDNMFKEFPIEICSLINLEILEMECNLSKYNNEICGDIKLNLLTGKRDLEYFNLETDDDTDISRTYIPNEIINLQKLRILKLQGRYVHELYDYIVDSIIPGCNIYHFPKYFLEKMNIEELYINNFNINKYDSIIFERFKVKKNLTIYSTNLCYSEKGQWASNNSYEIEISYDKKNNFITIIDKIIGENERTLKYKLIKNSDNIINKIFF